MRESNRLSFTWEGSATHLDRMSKANARADETWLRSLSVEEAGRILEDLCLGIPELDVSSELDPPPVVLSRLWRPS